MADNTQYITQILESIGSVYTGTSLTSANGTLGSEDPTLKTQMSLSSGEFAQNPNLIASLIRRKTIPAGAQPAPVQITSATFQSSTYNNSTENWRVRISLPASSTFRSSPLLQPLVRTDNSMIWPTTPNITLSHSATYNLLNLIHTNYAFPTYQHSQIDPIAIAGSFPVQSIEEGQYWIAAVHYLRSVSKMHYGETSDKGSPPPLVKLNGYGDFVFNNVPCVVTNFTVDLQNGVDYIKVPLMSNTGNTEEFTYVPTDSTIQVQLQPTYSRQKVSAFSFDAFVNGDLRGEGYI